MSGALKAESGLQTTSLQLQMKEPMPKLFWLLGPIVGIAGVGYWFSDARALDNLAHRERLNTPNRVFGYVTGQWS